MYKNINTAMLNTVISNDRNVGIGLRILLLLNSDTLITDNILLGMIKWMEDNSKVGISTCALKNTDGTLQGSGGYFPNLFRVFSWLFFLDDIPFLDLLIKPFHPFRL